MKRALYALVAACLAACSALPDQADPASDAPESRLGASAPFKDAPSYAEALTVWRSAEDVNAWIGVKFEYDLARAVQLSETQRQQHGRIPILKPEELFVAPRGVCVDLSRFAVETLRSIEPGLKPQYVMIEFDPVEVAGNTLRRHWLAAFERDGSRYFFGDSKRPGHLAGPYASTQEFMAEYTSYRARRIVSFVERASYERTARTLATKTQRQDR